MGGGGMRGVFGAGVVMGLKTAGLMEAFDDVVAVSAGVADCAYLLSGQPEFGTTIYFEDLASRKFINPFRTVEFMDIDYLANVFRRIKPLNQEKIRSSRSTFYIGLTEASTGQGELLNVKDIGDIVGAVCASCAMPIAYNRTIAVNGQEYCDGEVALGIPISKTLELGCTDLLLVLNNPIEEISRRPWKFFEPILQFIYLRHFTPDFRRALSQRDKIFDESLAVLDSLPAAVNVGILAPKNLTISRFSIAGNKLKQVAEDAENLTVELLG